MESTEKKHMNTNARDGGEAMINVPSLHIPKTHSIKTSRSKDLINAH